MKMSEIFFDISRETLTYQISWKFVHCKPRCSMLTEGQTDMTNRTESFRNFVKKPNTVRDCKPLQWPKHNLSKFSECDVVSDSTLLTSSLHITLTEAWILLFIWLFHSVFLPRFNILNSCTNTTCGDAAISLCTNDVLHYIFNLAQNVCWQCLVSRISYP
jgi:hypothetical protein